MATTRTTFEKYTMRPRFTWVSQSTRRKRIATKKIEVSYGYPLSIQTREEACEVANVLARQWLLECEAIGFPIDSGEPLSKQTVCVLEIVHTNIMGRKIARDATGHLADTEQARACNRAVSMQLGFILEELKGLIGNG